MLALADLEKMPEAHFLPTDTVRLHYEATNGGNYQESPYYGVVRVVMGSMQTKQAFFQTYTTYLQQQGWTQRDAYHAEDLIWEKDALTFRLMIVDPNNSRGIPAESKQVHRTWYVLLLGEFKGSECPPTAVPK